MKIEIKKFNELTAEELYKILQLRNDVFIVEQHCFYRDIDDRDFFAYHLQVQENGRLIGYLRILMGEEIQIGRVVVAADFRRQKIAEKMVEIAKEFLLKSFPEKTVFLEAQVYAISLYEKAGFVPIGEDFMEAGVLHHRMELMR